MQRKVNLIIYDVQGCLMHPNLQNEPFQEHMLSSDKNFFNAELERIQEEGITRVIFAETKPAEPLKTKYALPVLQHHFKNMLPDCEVMFDPFWTQLTDTIKRSLNHAAETIGDSDFSQEALERHHIITIIALAHRTAASFPDEEIAIQLSTVKKEDASSENKTDIVETFFRQHSDLLPNAVSRLTLLRHGLTQVDVLDCQLTGTGDIDLSYETDDKQTTADEWHKKNLLPEKLLTPEDVTRRLLAVESSRSVPTATATASSALPYAAPTAPAPSMAAVSAPVETQISDEPTVDSDELNVQESKFKADYKAGRITIKQYLDYLIYVNGATPYTPPDDKGLLDILQKIAMHPIWETKSKNVQAYNPLNGLWAKSAPSLPDSISEMRISMPSSIVMLSNKIKPKLESKIASATRSKTTTQFYELIVALASTTNNFKRMECINMFCERYDINYNTVQMRQAVNAMAR